MRLIKSQKNAVLFVGIFLILVVTAGMLIAKAPGSSMDSQSEPLELAGEEQYVDPGVLMYCSNGPTGLWIVNQKGKDIILSYVGEDGHKQWINIYETDKNCVSTNQDYSAVGVNNEIHLVDWQGLTQWKWQALGKINWCKANDQGQVLLTFETTVDDGTASGWANELVLLDSSGDPVFTRTIINEDVIDAEWVEGGVAVISYRIAQEESEQYLCVFDNLGTVTLSRKLPAKAIGALGYIAREKSLVLSVDEEVTFLNLELEESKQVDVKGVVGMAAPAGDFVYLVSRVQGWFGFGAKTLVTVCDSKGNTVSVHRFSGKPKDYVVGGNEELILATDEGVHGLKWGKSMWQIDVETSVLQVAANTTDFTIYLYDEIDTLLWYR